MSDNILIGKSRKTGRWVILASPDDPYGKHLETYRGIASAAPVNEDFSRVLSGRVQNTSTPLSLITGDENTARLKMLEATKDIAASAGENAVERQKQMDIDRRASAQKVHDISIDKKNALVNEIRKASGQEVFSKTKTEADAEALASSISSDLSSSGRPDLAAARKKALDDEAKSHEEQVAEKNRLIGETQKQAQETIEQGEQVVADKQARIGKKSAK